MISPSDMRTALYYFGLIFVALWLFTIHTAFAYSINPVNESKYFADLFIVQGIDFKKFIPYLWGASFSIAISIVISRLSKTDKYFWWFIFTIATLELCGVFLLTNTEILDSYWKIFSSFYYGVYGFVLIVLYGYVSQAKPPQKTARRAQKDAKPVQTSVNKLPVIGEMMKDVPIREAYVINSLKFGKSPKEICGETGLKPYQITRIKNKYKNNV